MTFSFKYNQKIFSLLQKINLKNFDKGIIEFLKCIESVSNSMEDMTQKSNAKKITDKKNLESIWGSSKKQTPIWSDNDSDNLEKIWGKEND
jgi:predicted DNA-binding antitoxin AbrB/MazE fold protein